MSRRNGFIAVFIFAVLFVVGSVWSYDTNRKACEAKGGTLITSRTSSVCVKSDAVLK